MNAIPRSELNKIMDNDYFYALPCSITKWIKGFELKLSEQVIFERIVSLLIQNTKYKNSMTIRLSQSIISEVTNIKERTVKNSLKGLIDKDLLTKINTCEKGTLYKVNIYEEIFLNTGERKKTKIINENHNYTENDQKTMPQRTEVPTASNCTKTSKKILNPLKTLLRSGAHKEKNNKQDLDKKRIKNINNSSISITPKHYSKIHHKNKKDSTNQLLSYRGSKQLEGQQRQILLHKLKKILGDKLAVKALDQIKWAMQFGWYSKKNMSAFYCVNHALKLIKDNAWTTPIGYSCDN